jgi:thiol-disulfide isomerase/thioredoxin
MSYDGKGNNFNFNQFGGSENTTISLYKADWCGHCKRFIPEWEKLKKAAESIEGLTVKTCDDKNNASEIAELKNKGLFHGYPTIIITKSTDEEYDGPRTASDILEKLGFKEQVLQKGGNPDEVHPQCGGATNTNQYYKMKYLKYKAKYMLARSRLEN